MKTFTLPLSENRIMYTYEIITCNIPEGTEEVTGLFESENAFITDDPYGNDCPVSLGSNQYLRLKDQSL